MELRTLSLQTAGFGGHGGDTKADTRSLDSSTLLKSGFCQNFMGSWGLRCSQQSQQQVNLASLLLRPTYWWLVGNR